MSIYRIEYNQELEWKDSEKRVVNEVSYKTIKLFGIPLYKKTFVSEHSGKYTDEDKSNIGFGKNQ